MEQNKVRIYLLYAIGEIALVMIGILLALQVNNWNEERKDRVVEKKILEEVLYDMQINRDDIGELVQIAEKRLNDISELNDHLINRKSNYDSLGLHLREASSTQQFSPRMIGVESLDARGVEIIQNVELRNRIVLTYGLLLQELVSEGREFEQFDNPTKDLLPYLKKHLVVDTNFTTSIAANDIGYRFTNYGLAVKNYDALLDDSEFILMLQKSMFNRANMIIIAKRLINHIALLEKMIEQELMKM